MNRFLHPCFLTSLLCNIFLTTSGYAEAIPGALAGPTALPESPPAPVPTVETYQNQSPFAEYTSTGWANLKMDRYTQEEPNPSPLFPTFTPDPSLNRPARISFPGVPPVLGDPISPYGFGFLRPNDTNANLSSCENEWFYAPLSGLLSQEDLSGKRRRKLETFLALRDQLLRELRSHIETEREAPRDIRREDFARLAAAQAPRLRELAEQAEALRVDFVHGGFFSTGVRWNDVHTWRPRGNLIFESQLHEASATRAAAYFQDGLSEGQRQLLRELSMELTQGIGHPTASLELDQPKPPLYFSPATARIRLPFNLPAEFSEKIDAYTAEKAELKRELRELISPKDSAWLNSSRTRALKELGQKQASRIAQLDIQAEEIREQWALLPESTQRDYEELPRELLDRIQQYLTRKQEVENEHNAKHPGPMRELQKEKEAIQNDVAAVLRQKYPLLNHVPIAALLREYGKIFQSQMSWQRHSEYRTAVLEPGLSPAQRRLLYGAALETL